MPPPTSKAWNYFKRTADSKIVKCKFCETEMIYTGGTTNILNHLRLKHNTGIDHENTPQKQPSMAEFVRSPRSRYLSGTKAEEITCAIVNMVVKDTISVAQSEGTFVTYLRFDVGGLVSDMLLLSTVFIKTF